MVGKLKNARWHKASGRDWLADEDEDGDQYQGEQPDANEKSR